MAFDHCPPGQADRALAEAATERTLEWLARCRTRFEQLRMEDAEGPVQALFPIVQGGVYADLRVEAARRTREAGEWHGMAIGGLSVGEPKPVTYEIL
jgi:queuine tRNA-ribosyltransferase